MKESNVANVSQTLQLPGIFEYYQSYLSCTSANQDSHPHSTLRCFGKTDGTVSFTGQRMLHFTLMLHSQTMCFN